MVRTIFFGLMLAILPTGIFAQSYQEDLSFIAQPKKPFVPIGNLGPIQEILNLRGFIPLSAKITKGWKATDTPPPAGMINDDFRWFKYPLKQGVREIYFGTTAADPSFQSTPIIDEDQLSGDDKIWAGFAYEISKIKGKDLFEQVGGDPSDFQQAEPVVAIVNKDSVFLVLNLRYKNFLRHGTGQTLVAYEFSKSLKTPKMYYLLYSTFHWDYPTQKKWEKNSNDLAKMALPWFLH